MALMVQERSIFDGLLEEFEAPKIDASLLIMSLLEESYCEEFNKEELNSVMRSLEEEIRVNTLANHDFTMEPEFVSEDNRD
ncbi:hypothetical protein CRYUN_Cryun26dG0115100 [Craigia yunnanensis]